MNQKRVLCTEAARDNLCRRAVLLVCLLVAGFEALSRSYGQTAAASAGFAPGARELFSLNFAQDPLGEFPRSIRQLSGNMEVVEKDGMKMLRASSDSEFLITLPERLPDRFTLEFDVITRAAGYNSMELAFEGTPTMNRSAASAYVSWWQGALTLFGGREAATNPIAMPPDVRAEIEGQLAELRVDFAGDNFKMYVNGRRIYSAPELKFVRARVLRVGLGGINSNQYAVHLARLRIADATTTSPVIAQQQSALTSTNASGSNLANPASTATPLAITGIAVSLNANGAAVVSWNPLPVAASYFVVRWNVNDPACCNAMSPPGLPLTSPMWQDIILPVRGTYAYRVIARTASGTIEGQTQYVYGAAPTPPPGVATVTPTMPTPVTTVIPTPGTIAPVPAPTTTTTVETATGAPRTGTILSPEPPPPTSPYGSVTSPTIMAPATTTTTTAPTTTEAITALPATMTGTGMLSSAPSTTSTGSGGGMPASSTPRYQVVLTGFAVTKLTNDDPLAVDGKGDEAFAAAAVVNWNRQTSRLTSYAFVQTHDYGDVSVKNLFPNRIQAGTTTATGGLAAGNRVPGNYDITGTNLPAPGADQFPLLIWEGELTAGVDSLVIAPSLWERDTVRLHFNNYKANWLNVSAPTLMATKAVATQYTTATLSPALIAMDPLINVAPPAPSFTQAPTSGYKIAALAFGPSSDRPIGMGAVAGVLIYQERVVLINREKLFPLNPGDGITIALPYPEPLDPMLGGIYTLYLRVQRVQ
jgi:hypothetical protein